MKDHQCSIDTIQEYPPHYILVKIEKIKSSYSTHPPSQSLPQIKELKRVSLKCLHFPKISLFTLSECFLFDLSMAIFSDRHKLQLLPPGLIVSD